MKQPVQSLAYVQRSQKIFKTLIECCTTLDRIEADTFGVVGADAATTPTATSLDGLLTDVLERAQTIKNRLKSISRQISLTPEEARLEKRDVSVNEGLNTFAKLKGAKSKKAAA